MPQRKQRRIKGEGTIFQRADGRYVSRYNGKTLYASNSYDAADNLQILKDQAKQEQQRFKTITVEQILTKFLVMKTTSLKAASQDRMESTIQCQINSRIGSRDASTLMADDFFNDVLNQMKAEGLSYSSIKKAYDTFNAGMRYGVAQKMIARNPLKVTMRQQKMLTNL